jgi:hypothetical protein
MKTFQAARTVLVLAGLLAAGGCVSPVRSPQDTALDAADRRALAAAIVDGWPDTSALAARRLMEQYGSPDEARSDHLVWYRNGPWARTVVREVQPPFVEDQDLGVVEQSIELPLGPGQAADVTAIDGRVTYDPTARQLTARSDREELNFLRLNLADDVASGRLSVEDARRTFALDLTLEAAGRTLPDMHGLRFPYGP